MYLGHVVPLIGGLLSNRTAYQYLPRSLAYLPDPATLMEMAGRSGFTDVERRMLSGGIVQLYTATRAVAR